MMSREYTPVEPFTPISDLRTPPSPTPELFYHDPSQPLTYSSERRKEYAEQKISTTTRKNHDSGSRGKSTDYSTVEAFTPIPDPTTLLTSLFSHDPTQPFIYRGGDGTSYPTRCASVPADVRRVVIHPSVTAIGDYAFYECPCLTSVSLSPTVRSIGRAAFDGCVSLGEIHIPPSVSTIGEYAFARCASLHNVEIDKGCKIGRIERCTFYNCSALETIELPPFVVELGFDAFSNCRRLLQDEGGIEHGEQNLLDWLRYRAEISKLKRILKETQKALEEKERALKQALDILEYDQGFLAVSSFDTLSVR